jgi:hypothetical protein
MRASTAILLLALFACNTEQKKCEHARDVFVRWSERASKDAIATITDLAAKGKAEIEAKAESERVRTRFVDACLALDEQGKACIARVDELESMQREVEGARKKCDETRDADGLPDPKCYEDATAKAKAAFSDCEESLGPMMQKVSAP